MPSDRLLFFYRPLAKDIVMQDSLSSSHEQEHRKTSRGKRLFLSAGAIVLLLVAMLCLWRLASGAASPASTDFYSSLGALFLSLLFFAGFVMEEAQVLQKERLACDYDSSLDHFQTRLSTSESMIRTISEHQTGTMAIFDRHNRFFFANERLARQFGKTVSEIIGKPPVKVMPNEQAMKLELRLAEARAAEEPVEIVEQTLESNGEARFLKRHYELIKDNGDMNGHVLAREDDLTDLIVEKVRREQMLKQIIDTLVAVVDRRDPYATGHSARVGQLARAIATEMGLEKLDIEASEIAGSLMNFGKVLVSRSILTKTSALTTEELQRVRESILISADILSIIGFEGPVVPTLRQVLERVDGHGAPDGLKGEEILITARIVAAANAYVAFVSPRAHRAGLSLQEALDMVERDSGKAYDGRVLVALRHYIENRPHNLGWLVPGKTT